MNQTLAKQAFAKRSIGSQVAGTVGLARKYVSSISAKYEVRGLPVARMKFPRVSAHGLLDPSLRFLFYSVLLVLILPHTSSTHQVYRAPPVHINVILLFRCLGILP